MLSDDEVFHKKALNFSKTASYGFFVERLSQKTGKIQLNPRVLGNSLKGVVPQ